MTNEQLNSMLFLDRASSRGEDILIDSIKFSKEEENLLFNPVNSISRIMSSIRSFQHFIVY